MEQSVPKRQNIKFRRRGITQKKAYNIQTAAKVWNQEHFTSMGRKLQDTFDYEDGTGCSETSEYKIQTPGNYPEENIEQLKFFLWFYCRNVFLFSPTGQEFQLQRGS